jgi:hypothetical protein
MKCTNARKLDRKSGVRLGERGAPVFPFEGLPVRENPERLVVVVCDLAGGGVEEDGRSVLWRWAAEVEHVAQGAGNLIVGTLTDPLLVEEVVFNETQDGRLVGYDVGDIIGLGPRRD